MSTALIELAAISISLNLVSKSSSTITIISMSLIKLISVEDSNEPTKVIEHKPFIGDNLFTISAFI
jgi:hypothetical protein